MLDFLWKFAIWFAGVLNDPQDKQGSTKRVCLMIFLWVILLLLSLITLHDMKLPIIPDSFLYLICFMILVFAGLITAEKGMASWKEVGLAKWATAMEPAAETAKTEQEPAKEAP